MPTDSKLMDQIYLGRSLQAGRNEQTKQLVRAEHGRCNWKQKNKVIRTVSRELTKVIHETLEKN